MNTDNILYYLNDLRETLKKHRNVKAVYKSFSEKEKESHRKILDYKENLYFESWQAFISNLSMLREINLEASDENKPTREVMEAAYRLFDYCYMENINKHIIVETEKNLLLFLDTASMLTVFCVNCQITRRISTLMDDELVMNNRISGKQIYRGVSNANYTLIPSIYRNLSIDGGFGVINAVVLENLYCKSNLLSKYTEVFGTDNIDYNFCAFAQHAKQYSPFLDFTEEYRVALSFATDSSVSINDYSKNDAALYSLSFDAIDNVEDIDNFSLSDIDVFINEKRMTMFSLIRGKHLFRCSYDDFRVEACTLTDKTNDRMKYQQGCFLYFKRAVIINGNLLLPINFGRIKKYTIPADGNTLTKKIIANKIKSKYRYYAPHYLMNPYEYFEESPL